MQQLKAGVVAAVILLGLLAGIAGQTSHPVAGAESAPVMLADGNDTPTPTPTPASPDGECKDDHCVVG